MNRFTDSFAKADEKFDNQFSEQLEQLKGLTQSEIEKAMANTSDIEIYRQLAAIVDDASCKNLKQAELVSKIKALGEIAINLAKKFLDWINYFNYKVNCWGCYTNLCMASPTIYLIYCNQGIYRIMGIW